MKTSIARIFFHKFSLLTNSKALCLSHSQNLRQSLFSLYFLQSTEFARVLFWFEVSATAPVSFENGRQLWIPAGFLHGFVTRQPDTEIVYKCTAHYSAANDGGVRWDTVGINWGVDAPILSDKDRVAPAFADWQSPFTYEA